MIKLEIIDNVLHLSVEGMDKILALKSKLSVPLEHITAIRIDEEIVKNKFHGFKMPGTTIPGIITAGSFYQDGKHIFWDIHHPKQAVIISLDHEHYDQLVIEVENPESFVQEVQGKIQR